MVGGVPFSVLLVFFGWGHLSKLGLGLGCSGPFGCPVGFVRALFSGSTIVLEGISLALDRFPSSDICLAGVSQDVLVGNYGVCMVWGRTCAVHVLSQFSLGFCRKYM